jgi:chemotaxis family two-component system response regulator Rcp1
MFIETVTKPQILLLVENNKADIYLIKEALKISELPHQIVTARDGMEAMDYLHQAGQYSQVSLPDLILLDLNLPKKDGYEVLVEIKCEPKLKDIPLVVLTTSRNEDDILQGYDVNLNCYLTKPRNLQDLFQLSENLKNFWLLTENLPSK